MLNFKPTRAVETLPNGNYKVTVTPPSFLRLAPGATELTPDQFERYNDWLYGRVLIQDALPDLSLAQREILMSGMVFLKMEPQRDGLL